MKTLNKICFLTIVSFLFFSCAHKSENIRKISSHEIKQTWQYDNEFVYITRSGDDIHIKENVSSDDFYEYRFTKEELEAVIQKLDTKSPIYDFFARKKARDRSYQVDRLRSFLVDEESFEAVESSETLYEKDWVKYSRIFLILRSNFSQ